MLKNQPCSLLHAKHHRPTLPPQPPAFLWSSSTAINIHTVYQELLGHSFLMMTEWVDGWTWVVPLISRRYVVHNKIAHRAVNICKWLVYGTRWIKLPLGCGNGPGITGTSEVEVSVSACIQCTIGQQCGGRDLDSHLVGATWKASRKGIFSEWTVVCTENFKDKWKLGVWRCRVGTSLG